MCTDRKPFLTMGPATRTFKKECRKIKCSDMCDILKVDHEAMTVTCEPLVNMGHITRALLPMGCGARTVGRQPAERVRLPASVRLPSPFTHSIPSHPFSLPFSLPIPSLLLKKGTRSRFKSRWRT